MLHIAVEDAARLGAGAVNGSLDGGDFRCIRDVEERFLGLSAALEPPGRADDFGDEELFGRVLGVKGFPQARAKGFVLGGVGGSDAVAPGKQTGLEGVFGDAEFAVGGSGSGGRLRVGAVGRDLSRSCRLDTFLSIAELGIKKPAVRPAFSFPVGDVVSPGMRVAEGWGNQGFRFSGNGPKAMKLVQKIFLRFLSPCPATECFL